MKSTGGCALRISAGFLREMKQEAGCSGLQRCSQQSLQDRADRSIFSIGSGAAAVKRKNSRKMQKFRKQESTNISPRKVRFCLTSVLQIIIMKKLHRGVAQMVARMVRDHEAASSSLATPTKTAEACWLRRFFISRVQGCSRIWVTVHSPAAFFSTLQRDGTRLLPQTMLPSWSKVWEE